MKKMQEDTDVLGEYDFGNGVQGKYAKRYAEGANGMPTISMFYGILIISD